MMETVPMMRVLYWHQMHFVKQARLDGPGSSKSLTCVLFHMTEALECPSLFLQGPLS